MNFRIELGRPRKRIIQEIQVSPKNNNFHYISDDPHCVKLIKLFLIQGNYKVRILTGPHQTRQLDDIQQDEVLQQEPNQSNYPKYYFLTTEKNKYSIEKDKIVDNNLYLCINSNTFPPQFQILVYKLNFVLQELDKNFIFLLLDILRLYIQFFDLNLDEETLVQSITQELESPQYSENFQYLVNWQIQRNKTKEARNKVYLEDNKKRKMLLNSRTSRKVIQKLEKIIEKQEKQFQKEFQMEPINYLLLKLVKIFNRIMKVN